MVHPVPAPYYPSFFFFFEAPQPGMQNLSASSSDKPCKHFRFCTKLEQAIFYILPPKIREKMQNTDNKSFYL